MPVDPGTLALEPPRSLKAALDSLADYARCLAARHACAIDEMVRFEAPRADEWIGTWPGAPGTCPAELE